MPPWRGCATGVLHRAVITTGLRAYPGGGQCGLAIWGSTTAATCCAAAWRHRLPRKLTAILYADVAGYSRLTGEDEDATHRHLREYLDLATTAIDGHGGRVLHYAGDAVLAQFEAAVDALTCAARMQRDLAIRNADLPDDRKVQFRIGINIGDVIEDRGEIYGDGVNVAARLETLAEPGGICVSGAVFDAIGDKLPFDYEPLGEQTVKNIANPVRAYRARLLPDADLPAPPGPITPTAPPGRKRIVAVAATLVAALVAAASLLYWTPWETREEPASVERMAYPLPEKPSIAVLPFDNLSGDASQAPLVDGTTESLITTLAKVPNLFVIARNSSFTYKGKAVRVKQVAEELGVRYVLEGSMQRSGDRVRVNAQLIDALSGRHLWAERYDRETGDLFALQDDIIGNVTREIEVALTEGDQARLYRRTTDDFEAYLHVMRGMGHFRKFRRDENARARIEFEKALALDPDYGFALQQFGYTHWADARYRWSDSRAASLAQAEALATQATEAGYAAHSLLSSIYFLKGDFERALDERRRDLELRPNGADVQALMAWTLTLVGRPAEAIEHAKSAMRLSPFYPNWYLGVLGDAYRLLGRFDEAVEAFETVVERDPKDIRIGRVRLAASLAQAGRIDQARRVVDDLLALKPDFTVTAYAKSRLYRDPAVTERMTAALREAGLPD